MDTTVTKKRLLRLGTRGSRLAIAQTELVASLLKAKFDYEVEVVPISTRGDQNTEKPIRQLGSVGVFTKELEDALFDNKIDLALHCLKDMPTQQPKGLEISAYLERELIHDCLVFRAGEGNKVFTIEDLADGTVIGTSAVRRRAQILNKKPSLKVVECRGNLDTRVAKLLNSEIDVLCLAAAGLKRAGFYEDSRIKIVDLSERDFYPCAAQGCLVLQNKKDFDLKKQIKKLNHKNTQICVNYERDLLALLEGGCSLPLGVFSEIVDGELILKGILLSEDGKEFITVSQATRELDDPHLVDNIITEIKERHMGHLLPNLGD